MKVFVAGSTGVLGRSLVRQLRNRGHQVVGLCRDESAARMLRSFDAEPARADLFDPVALTRVAEGCEVVIHAATAIPVRMRPSARDWRANDRLRREGTAALLACASRIGARRYLQQSVVWLAAPPSGTPFDEASPAHPDAVTRSALDGERLALAAANESLRVAVLRCGWFYGAQAAHTRALGFALLRGQAAVIGAGDAALACLHVDDAATAFAAASEGRRGGIFHVVDEAPVTVRELMDDFARRLGARPPRSIPALAARLLLGSTAVKFLTTSTRTSHAKFAAAFGWRPRVPNTRVGLEMVVSSWEKHGFPERGLPWRAARARD